MKWLDNHPVPSLRSSTSTNFKCTRKPGRRTLLALAIAQTLVLPGVQAASIVVDNSGDTGAGCTLREAVISINLVTAQTGCSNSSSDGFGTNDQVSFSVPAVNLNSGNGQISIDKNLRINGSVPHAMIDGTGNGGRLFSVTHVGDTYFDKLILQGGSDNIGGAVFLGTGTLTISNSELKSNTSIGGGGAIRVSSGGVLNINTSVVSNNVTQGRGGAIDVSDGTLNVTDSILSGNESDSQAGGGINVGSASTLDLTRSTVTGNTANRGGGGVYFIGSLGGNIKQSTISGNVASLGAGIGIIRPSLLTITDSTISNNSAATGGAIRVYEASLSIANSTLSGNVATWGGGIDATRNPSNSNNYSNIDLTNSTLFGNNSSYDGGSLRAVRSSTIRLSNTIVSHSLLDNCYKDATSIISANITSIIEDGSCSTTALSVDPDLGSLQNNGGLTQTHAPGSESPAIGAADALHCPRADQRGELRDADGLMFPVVAVNGNMAVIGLNGECDIGAVEL